VIKPIRTWLDIWFSGFNGTVVKAIVSRDRKKFIAKAIIEFGMMMVKNHTKNMPGVKVILFFFLSCFGKLTYDVHVSCIQKWRTLIVAHEYCQQLAQVHHQRPGSVLP